MAKNIGDALVLLNRLGAMDINGINMDSTNKVISHINHKYREDVIVPYVAISNNIALLIGKGEKQIITADNIVCDVLDVQEVHICELENKVMDLYKMDCWSFIKRWYTTKNTMDSLHFVCLKLKKHECN